MSQRPATERAASGEIGGDPILGYSALPGVADEMLDANGESVFGAIEQKMQSM